MWPIFVLLGIGAGAAGTYLVMRPKENRTGEIYGILLSGVPATANVDAVGDALMDALNWKIGDIEDGSMDRYPQGAMFTVGFKGDVQTPRLPSVGFSFKVGAATVTVTSVTRAPAKVPRAGVVNESSFP